MSSTANRADEQLSIPAGVCRSAGQARVLDALNVPDNVFDDEREIASDLGYACRATTSKRLPHFCCIEGPHCTYLTQFEGHGRESICQGEFREFLLALC